MDRPIEATVLAGRKRRGIISLAGGAAAVLLLFLLLPGWVRPSLERSRITTARVDRGPIDVTLSASGVVTPEIERTITAPGASRVLRVLKQAGEEKLGYQTPKELCGVLVHDRAQAVELFCTWLHSPRDIALAWRLGGHTLRGKNLACWCPLDGPCHAA